MQRKVMSTEVPYFAFRLQFFAAMHIIILLDLQNKAQPAAFFPFSHWRGEHIFSVSGFKILGGRNYSFTPLFKYWGGESFCCFFLGTSFQLFEGVKLSALASRRFV